MDNTIPAIERAIRVVETIERAAEPLAAEDLAPLRIPRTTLYRILRILAAAGWLAEKPGNVTTYTVGPAIRRMATALPDDDDVALRARPVMERLSTELRETVKLVVRDGLETVAVAVLHPQADSRIATRLGSRLPLHVGAGQRLLLSRAPDAVVEQVLARRLEKRGIDTIVDPEVLRRNLVRLRRQDWALGRNEGAAGVGSIAALVHEAGRPFRTALVVTYVLSGRRHADVLRMRDAVLAGARSLSG
jgi:IclR family acetate operon transcriptional repressor